MACYPTSTYPYPFCKLIMSSQNPWQIVVGTRPVLLVAGHCFPHHRQGRIKPRDVNTDQIALALASTTQCSAIVSTSVQSDPNWYANSPFRQAVKSFISHHQIQTVYDLHGRRVGYPHLLEYFANQEYLSHYASYLTFGRLGRFIKNHQFTLAEDLQSLPLSTLEVEIRRDGREPQSDPYHLVFDHLVSLITKTPAL